MPAPQTLNLVCDSSTLANFKAWAQPISSWFTSCGWTQSSDTGQVNWSTIAAVPGAAAYVYEIWQPGDGLQTFYVKIEYGNVSGANCPSLRITIGTGTNGSGTLTGFVASVLNTNFGTFTPPSTTTQYPCHFSGDSGGMSVMMWRGAPNNAPQAFVIERSVTSSGTYYGTSTTGYVTAVVFGTPNNSGFVSSAQQSLVFGVGVTNTAARNGGNGALPSIHVRLPYFNGNTTSAFNGAINMDTVSPNVGFFDYPMTRVGVAASADIAEGVTFTATLYGTSRTFMPSKASPFLNAVQTSGVTTVAVALCLRYD
jgi:hypothetical protein